MPDDNVTATADPPQPIDPLSDTPLSSLIQQQQPPAMPNFTSSPSPLSAITNAATDPEIQASGVHHWRLANLANSVGSMLGGDRTLKVTQNDDGTVSLNYQPSTMGEKWGRIAQAALKGAALGFQAGQGPGGAQKAAAASILGGMDMPRQREQTIRQDAISYNKEKRDEQLFKANMQHMAQQNAIGAFQLDSAQKHEAEGEEDRQNALDDFINKNHAKVYEFSDAGDLARQFNRTPDIVEAQKEGRASVHHNPTGQGGRIVVVPHNKLDDYVQDDWTPMATDYDPKNLKRGLYYTPMTKVPGGTQTVRERQAAEALLENKSQETKKAFGQLYVEQMKYDSEATERRLRVEGLQTENAIRKLQYDAAKYASEWRNAPAGTFEPDPEWPKLPPGTPGVMPPKKDGSYTIPADVARGERQAQLMDAANLDLQSLLIGMNPKNNGERFDINKVLGGLSQIDTSKLSGLLPAGMSTYAEAKTLGLPDTPEGRATAALISASESYTRAGAGVHNFRNMFAPQESAHAMLNNFQNSPAAAQQYLAVQNDVVKQMHNMYKSSLMYGSLQKPDQKYITQAADAERKAYLAAKQSAATGGTPAAAATGEGATNEQTVTIQLPTGTWTGPASKADAARQLYGNQQGTTQPAAPAPQSGLSIPGITNYLQNLFTPRQ